MFIRKRPESQSPCTSLREERGQGEGIKRWEFGAFLDRHEPKSDSSDEKGEVLGMSLR